MIDNVFSQLMQEMAKQAERHARTARTLTMAAMVNWFVFNADVTTHVTPETSPVIEQRKVFRDKCVEFKNNRNDIYNNGAEMHVLDVALRDSSSPAAHSFIGETPAIIGKKTHRQFIANNDNMTRETRIVEMYGMKEAVASAPEPEQDSDLSFVKDGNVLYPQFRSNIAA